MDIASPDDTGELVVVLSPGDDAHTFETGVRGWWDAVRGEFVVPITDATTAEEVGRILTGGARRIRAEES